MYRPLRAERERERERERKQSGQWVSKQAVTLTARIETGNKWLLGFTYLKHQKKKEVHIQMLTKKIKIMWVILGHCCQAKVDGDDYN